MRHPWPDLTPLRQLSARIGNDLNLVQAGGGNTSLKDDGMLWVKASGKWLARALEEDIFLPVPTADILRSIAEEREQIQEYETLSGARLRPSVETAMHAVLPHTVVVHVHSVNTIAWAARTDAPDALAGRLEGMRWTWIPYVHPGLILGQRIQETLASKPDVLVLGNHGLVIGASDCIAAEHLLREVEYRLEHRIRTAPQPDLAKLAELAPEGWRVAPDDETHALATDPFSLRVAKGGVLYPDQCVYLGPKLSIAGEETPTAAAKVLLVPGRGVLVSANFDRAARELLIGVKRVIERLDSTAQVKFLDSTEVARLLNWDAEKYRIAMAKGRDILAER